MAIFCEERVVKFSKEVLFSLVADVQSYPRFVPGCKRVSIQKISDTQMRATLYAAMGPIAESYTSLVTLTPNERVEAVSNDGPFTKLRNLWTFTEVEGGVKVRCEIECDFKSMILSTLAMPFFNDSSRKTMNAFLERAKQLSE